MLCYVLSCCVLLCHVAPCCAMLRYVVSYAMLRHIFSCYTMLCHVVPCCAMLCHVVSCCAMLCHVLDARSWTSKQGTYGSTKNIRRYPHVSWIDHMHDICRTTINLTPTAQKNDTIETEEIGIGRHCLLYFQSENRAPILRIGFRCLPVLRILSITVY